MRWTHKFYDNGDFRTKSGFLVFPLRIGEDVRWLERATWKEEYVSNWGVDTYWCAIEWISD